MHITNLTKSFGHFTAVSSLHLTVNRGEIFGFLGPNGAGKTTTIKMITGLLKPTKGEIFIDGEKVGGNTVEAKKHRGYLADVPFLYDYLTPVEYLFFMADMKDMRNPKERIEELLTTFDLTEKRTAYCGDLSHGMKKKTALAGAIIDRAPLLILDEPLSGLDPLSQAKFKEVINDLAQKGSAIFLSTHILDDAQKLCDRIGILHKGRLIETGTVDSLTEKAGTSGRDLESLFLKLTGSGK